MPTLASLAHPGLISCQVGELSLTRPLPQACNCPFKFGLSQAWQKSYCPTPFGTSSYNIVARKFWWWTIGFELPIVFFIKKLNISFTIMMHLLSQNIAWKLVWFYSLELLWCIYNHVFLFLSYNIISFYMECLYVRFSLTLYTLKIMICQYIFSIYVCCM